MTDRKLLDLEKRIDIWESWHDKYREILHALDRRVEALERMWRTESPPYMATLITRVEELERQYAKRTWSRVDDILPGHLVPPPAASEERKVNAWFPPCTSCGRLRYDHSNMALGHGYKWPPEFDGPIQKAIDEDEGYAPPAPETEPAASEGRCDAPFTFEGQRCERERFHSGNCRFPAPPVASEERCLHPLDRRRDNKGNFGVNELWCDKCGQDVTAPETETKDECWTLCLRRGRYHVYADEGDFCGVAGEPKPEDHVVVVRKSLLDQERERLAGSEERVKILAEHLKDRNDRLAAAGKALDQEREHWRGVIKVNEIAYTAEKGMLRDKILAAEAEIERLTARVKDLTRALSAIADYDPTEVCKDDFAYDRLVNAYKTAAKNALTDAGRKG